MEGMTEDHEGIFVDIMPRNHLCLFLTKWEKRRRRTRRRKNRDGERKKTPAAEFLSQEYTTWYMPNKCPPRGGMVTREIDWTLSFKEIIIVTKAVFFSEPSIEIYNNRRINSYDGKQLVSEASLSSDCEMKSDASSGYQTEISTDTVSQSQSSRELKTSGFPCNPGMQKHELFFLLWLISTLLYLKGRSDC